MNKISNQYSLYNFGRFFLLIIMVLVLLLFNTKIYANEKELSETVTKKYDDFTTYYRIANGKDIQVSESDIVYSKDELDNILNMKSSKGVFDQIDEKIKALPDNLIKSIKNRSGLYVASKNNQVEIYNPKVLIKYNSSEKEDVGANYLYKVKFIFTVDDASVPICMYSFVSKNVLAQDIKENENINKIKYKDIIQKKLEFADGNNKFQKAILEKIKDETIKTNGLIQNLNILESYRPISYHINIDFDFGFLLLHGYVLTFSIGLMFLIYAIIISLTTNSLLHWNKKMKNEHFYKLVKRVKENRFR